MVNVVVVGFQKYFAGNSKRREEESMSAKARYWDRGRFGSLPILVAPEKRKPSLAFQKENLV